MIPRNWWPPGHVVHMSIEETPHQAVSLAACDCGWDHRVKWPASHTDHARQDSAIERHWRQVEAAR